MKAPSYLKSSPSHFPLCPLCVTSHLSGDTLRCLSRPSSPEHSFSDVARHSPPSSKLLLLQRGYSCTPSTAGVTSQIPTNTHSYFNRTLRYRQKTPFRKAHLPNNNIVKTREISSMPTCSTRALPLTPHCSSCCYCWPLACRSKD